MDGFESTEAVVVLAATNRLDVLDSALLRPGRFDRRVVVQPPDRAGRAAILRVHTQGMPLAAGVDLGTLAATTPGMVGADLANLANEAALLAARRGHKELEMADFTDSLEKIMLGAPRGIILSPADRERTAYHESGHALLGKILVALGGRVAEEVVYGTITTGAESDIQQLTSIARQMVGRWGMSEEIGPVAVIPSDAMGYLLPGAKETSEATQQLIDAEVRRLIDDAHHQATDLLTKHRDQLETLTRALLEAETLDMLDAYAAAGLPAHLEAEEPLGARAEAGAAAAHFDTQA
jgi:cell division protease FtsH